MLPESGTNKREPFQRRLSGYCGGKCVEERSNWFDGEMDYFLPGSKYGTLLKTHEHIVLLWLTPNFSIYLLLRRTAP